MWSFHNNQTKPRERETLLFVGVFSLLRSLFFFSGLVCLCVFLHGKDRCKTVCVAQRRELAKAKWPKMNGSAEKQAMLLRTITWKTVTT